MPVEDLVYYSGAEMDHVIFSQQWSTTVTNSIGTSIQTWGDTLLNQFAYPIGIYSYDGGVTWNDFVPNPIPGGSLLTNSNATIQPAVFVTPRVTAAGILSFGFAVKATVGGGATIPLIIRIGLLATSNPTITNGELIQSAVNKSAYITSSGGMFTQYRQISQTPDPTINSTAVPSHYATIPHGLGQVPHLFVWWFDGTFQTIFSNYWDVRYNVLGSNSGVSGFGMDSTNVYPAFSFTALAAGRTTWRTYKEN